MAANFAQFSDQTHARCHRHKKKQQQQQQLHRIFVCTPPESPRASAADPRTHPFSTLRRRCALPSSSPRTIMSSSSSSTGGGGLPKYDADDARFRIRPYQQIAASCTGALCTSLTSESRRVRAFLRALGHVIVRVTIFIVSIIELVIAVLSVICAQDKRHHQPVYYHPTSFQ